MGKRGDISVKTVPRSDRLNELVDMESHFLKRIETEVADPNDQKRLKTLLTSVRDTFIDIERHHHVR